HARARVLGIDTSEARALPGVAAVFVAGDINPGMQEQWHTMLGPDSPETARPPLAADEVRFAGDPVALVAAKNRYGGHHFHTGIRCLLRIEVGARGFERGPRGGSQELWRPRDSCRTNRICHQRLCGGPRCRSTP